MSDPPRKATEPTLVIDRSKLPPVRRIDRDAPTLVPCPACDGEGMVTVAKRAELADLLAPETDEPTDAPPRAA